MTTHGHPMRQAEIHTFKRQGGAGRGVDWIARFHPYDLYPVFFHGSDEGAAIAAAEAIRSDAIKKHEAACITRQKLAASRKSLAQEPSKFKETE